MAEKQHSMDVEVEPGERLHRAIARELGVRIAGGTWPPLHILPGEVEFAETLAVSRSALREAIRMLAAKGLVESRPKVGTRIRPRSEWNLLDPDLLQWMFASEPPRSFLHDLFELRMVIEPAAAAHAARRRSGSHLSTMGHSLEEMARHGLTTAEGQAADQRFHTAILDATGNELLINLASSIAAAVRWTTIYKHRKDRLPRDPIPEHRAVYDAIANADAAGASAAMAILVERALEDTQL